MTSNRNFFKKTKTLPVDKFLEKVLFDKKDGYYSSIIPFGKKGDYLTKIAIIPLLPFSQFLSYLIIIYLKRTQILILNQDFMKKYELAKL